MRQDRRFQKKKGLTAEQKRLIPLAGIVIVLIILILIVFAVGKKNQVSDTQATAEVSSNTEEFPSSENAPSTPETEISGNPEEENSANESDEETTAAEANPDLEVETEAVAALLQKNSIPEILSVMEQYFTARANADADTINALYGITAATDDSLAAHRQQLLSAAKYISSFDDVTTYVMDGTAENNWLVYTTTDIRFFAATAKAPMIMWCFMEKGSDDAYYILDNRLLPEDMLAYADIANRSEEVRALASEVNGRLRAALEEDADLDEVYGILRDGSPLWGDEEEDEAEVVILDDSETAAGDSSEDEAENSEEDMDSEADESPATEDGEQSETDSTADTETEADADNDANVGADTETGTSTETDAGSDAVAEASDDADETPAETQ